MNNTETVEDWEKRFDKEFMADGELLMTDEVPDDASDIKQFIRQEFVLRDKQLREEIINELKKDGAIIIKPKTKFKPGDKVKISNDTNAEIEIYTFLEGGKS